MTTAPATASQLASSYEASVIEPAMAALWDEHQVFRPENNPKLSEDAEAFSLVIPPPNVTGTLHMGHALDSTIQDIIIRWNRMSGKRTLWLPGMDHAGIATQNVVEKQLQAGNIAGYPAGTTRHDVGKERFLELVWQWAKSRQQDIWKQFKRLGISPDWSRQRFTLDEGLCQAVRETFVRLYEAGLIYRGRYIVNWDPVNQSAISDIETEYHDEEGHLWEIAYPLKDESGHLVVATTRPETLYGDVAVAVHPEDERYRHLIGKTVVLPLANREIPIIGDSYVDAEFGTGCLKITPAHDPNDFEVAKRHNLDPLIVLDEEARIKPLDFIPNALHGLDRYEARAKTEALLEERGALVSKKDHAHRVGRAQRSGAVIEPLLSEQWFVKTKPLAEQALKALEAGEIEFIPERWTKDYLRWMTNIQDWCISRQLWWGHPIPAWYHNETKELYVGHEPPQDAENWTAETDVLDTWFSSGLWPFSTMGWPNEQAEDFQRFYPTSTLVTGFDIIFFWVARMTMMGQELTGKSPFKTVYIHGLVRDEKGQKMSKSKGNTVDPVQLIEELGCDGFRFGLMSLITYGAQDIKLAKDKLEQGRLFSNKLWNATRFTLMNLNNGPIAPALDDNLLTTIDRWILGRYEATVQEANEQLATHRFGELTQTLLSFTWYEFCDWYVEAAKAAFKDPSSPRSANTRRLLLTVLDGVLRLLHPVMPHITEALWQALPEKEDVVSICLAAYPTCADSRYHDETLESNVSYVLQVVRALRNLRQQYNVAPNKTVSAILETDNAMERQALQQEEALIRHFIPLEGFTIRATASDEEQAEQMGLNVVGETRVLVPLAGLIDLEQERKRLEKKHQELMKEQQGLYGRLSNSSFLERAPEEVVEKSRLRLNELNQQLKVLEEQIGNLGAA